MPEPIQKEVILESIADGVFTVDTDWRITYFNKAAESITGISRAQALGRNCFEVFRSSMCEADCPLRRTFKTGKPVIGRSGFIITPDGRRIPISVSTALLRDSNGTIIGGAETFRDLSVVEQLYKHVTGRFTISDLVTSSPAILRIIERLPQIAASDSTVLLLGQTGTGKELLARAIHNHSKRKDRPFVAVNCAALPDTLLDSELFGYKKGAFTGADRDKPGRFDLAQGGTIFLDEIGDISPALQVRLLRVLQEKVYEPVGATSAARADVRVIAATNRDLARLVEEGRFRKDLYYRLNVIRIELPALRDRRGDIPALIDHFIWRFNQLTGKSITGVGPEAMSLFMSYDYPGNIRELENIIEHAFVLCDKGLIQIQHLPDHLVQHLAGQQPGKDLRSLARNAEAQLIRDALRRNNFNRLAAARELGMHKSTLFRKIKALGIEVPKGSRGSSSRKPAT
ncbi:MAG: sigma 54-interacting transcriptional regulator [Sedimentisphaerales bacterium]|nr:sigma 54-interacting transcriptional regulator [Sedimentisphaerales bacterium]